MNGKKSIEDDTFFTKAKEKELKKKLSIKYITLLIVTNSILLLEIISPKEIVSVNYKVPLPKDNERRIIIPLKLKVPLEGFQTKVGLYSQSGKFISFATIIKQVKKKSNFSSSEYEIDIDRNSLGSVLSYADQLLSALPPESIKTKKKSKRRIYEITL